MGEPPPWLDKQRRNLSRPLNLCQFLTVPIGPSGRFLRVWCDDELVVTWSLKRVSTGIGLFEILERELSSERIVLANPFKTQDALHCSRRRSKPIRWTLGFWPICYECTY